MATFEAQVVGLTGLTIDDSSAPTRAELNQFLSDGAKEVLNSLPRSRQEMFTTSNELNSSSVSLTLLGSEVFSVTRDDGTINQPCRKVPASLNGRIRDSGDMMAATATDPAYYIVNNILSVVPEPSNSNNAHVQTLAYPTVSYTHELIAKFPDDGEYLVPLYASIKSLQNKMSSKFAELPTDVTFTSLPVAPVAPVLISNQIGTLPTAPVYTGLSIAPSFSTVDTFISTDEDVELASVKIQEINSQINEYQASMQNQMNLFNDANIEYQAEVNKLIENARLSSQDDAQSLQKYSNELSSYSTKVQIYQADASTKIQNYNAKIQKHITDYQWLSGQYKQLKDDYTAGLQKLIS
tara:strand:- start:654 stop:1709 length:1056 start_codon:yes stop_codon:yes gene_type:complete